MPPIEKAGRDGVPFACHISAYATRNSLAMFHVGAENRIGGAAQLAVQGLPPAPTLCTHDVAAIGPCAMR